MNDQVLFISFRSHHNQINLLTMEKVMNIYGHCRLVWRLRTYLKNFPPIKLGVVPIGGTCNELKDSRLVSSRISILPNRFGVIIYKTHEYFALQGNTVGLSVEGGWNYLRDLNKASKFCFFSVLMWHVSRSPCDIMVLFDLICSKAPCSISIVV